MTHTLDCPTSKRILLVEVPENCHDFRITYGGKHTWLDYREFDYIKLLANEQPELTIIGKLSEIDLSPYVESNKIEWGAVAFPDGSIDRSLEGIKFTAYRDYTKPNTISNISSTDSFRSFLASKGFVFEEPPHYKYQNPELEDERDVNGLEEWHHKQLSKYIDWDRTLLIEVKQ